MWVLTKLTCKIFVKGRQEWSGTIWRVEDKEQVLRIVSNWGRV